jgi:hypothetical protein
VPCPSRVLCERAGLLTDGKIGTWVDVCSDWAFHV